MGALSRSTDFVHRCTDEASQILVSDPELVSELVGMLQPSNAIPEELRAVSLRALAVQLLDRSRHVGAPASTLRTRTPMYQAGSGRDRKANVVLQPLQSPIISAMTSGGQGGLLYVLMQNTTAGLTSAKGSEPCSVHFAEALLSLLSLLVATNSGCAALSQAGMIPALLPLLKDANSDHLHLVSTTIRVMEAFMDFSSSAASLFRELNGLTDLCVWSKRLPDVIPQAETSPGQIEAGKVEGRASALPYARRVLIKSLLRGVAMASYAPTNGSSARLELTNLLVYGQDADAQNLYASLKIMMERGEDFGGGLFALATSVMTDLIHHDPLCYNTLDAAGLPEAFLSAVSKGVMPSNEAVCNVPNTLVALCLTAPGLERVRKSRALRCFIPIMTTRKYQKALQGESATVLGAGLDELLRHVPTLRTEGIEVLLEVLRRLLELGGATVPDPPPPPPPKPAEEGHPSGTDSAAAAAAEASTDPSNLAEGTLAEPMETGTEAYAVF
eukprot:scaffold4915_cov42-Prasinocladus_malaysianus.AAC.1